MNSFTTNLSEDTRMIHDINAIRHDSKWIKPKGIDQLSVILKSKTKDKDVTYGHQLEMGRQWLSNKGIHLTPLLNRVTLEKQKQERQLAEPTFSDDYFHVTLKESSINEYIVKSEQYASMNLMQFIMDRRQHRPKFAQRYIEKQLNQGPNNFASWSGQNSKEKRNKYIQLMKDVISKKLDRQVQCTQLLKQFRSTMVELGDDFLWETIWHQLSTFKREMTREQNIAKMFVTSYKLIQQDFQKKVHNQDLERFVTRQYTGKVEGKWAFEHGGFWARVWLNYCMGMKDEVINLLSGGNRDFRELIKLYIAAEDALDKGKPIKENYVSRYDIEDIFYEQFIFTITGQPRYSSEFMAEKLGLQLILIVVRTIGVYYETQRRKLETVRARLLRNYRDYASDPQIMRNILYLVDFDELIRMGANSLLTGDDYLHLLIVLTGFPQLVNRQQLNEALSPLLVRYIMELISEDRKQYIYYLTIFSEKDLLRDVSSMILAANAFDKFNWKDTKQLIGEDLFCQLATITIEKFRLRTRDNLKAAKKVRELLEDDQKAIRYLLGMLVNHYLCKNKYDKDQISEAIDLGSQISKQESLPRVYQHVFDFIKAYRSMSHHLARKDEKTIYSFISNCEFIILDGSRGHPLSLSMLEVLVSIRGVDLYYDFLLKLLRGAEMCAGRTGEDERLRWVKDLISETLNVIENLNYMSTQLKSEYLFELREELNEQIF